MFLVVVIVGVLLPVANAASHLLDISVAKAPIVADGTTAYAPTDIVLTFEDPDPSVPGIPMQTGGTA